MLWQKLKAKIYYFYYVKLVYSNTGTALDSDFDPIRLTSVTITGDGINSSFNFSNTITQDLINEGIVSYDV